MSNNNGSRYLIESREQKRKLSLLNRERIFSVCFLHFRNALGCLERDGAQLTRNHSTRGLGWGRKGSFFTAEITNRKIGFLLLIFLGFLPSWYPGIFFSFLQEKCLHISGGEMQTGSGVV